MPDSYVRINFRPLREAEYALAEAFKRATTRDGMGSEELFEVWFPPERSYGDFVRRTQAFDPLGYSLAEVDGQIVGGLHLCMKEGKGHLNNIYLKPEWRGRRLGDELEAYALAFFKRHGATYATLRTNPQQPKSMAFYERLGWTLVAEEAAREDGTVMLGKMIG